MQNRQTEIEKWLIDILQRWEDPCVDFVREQAKLKGYKKAELKEARQKLGITTVNNNIDGETNWYWCLPQHLKQKR